MTNLQKDINTTINTLSQIIKEEVGDINTKEENSVCDQKNIKHKGTNVIYLTTRCNLECEYCYEKDNRDQLKDKQKDITKEKIDQFLKDIVNREGQNHPSVIVIFGGEPFLRFDLITYLIRKGEEINPNFSYSLPTNAIFFSKEENVDKFCNFYYSMNNPNSLQLEISYDGQGQYRRKFPDGSPTEEYVIKALMYLNKRNFPICVRYTIHAGNYNTVIEDTIRILETYNNVYKIQFSLAYTDLDTIEEIKERGHKHYENKLKPYMQEIFKIYNVSLCDFVCNLCKKCHKVKNLQYYLPDKDTPLYMKQGTQKEFNHFIS